MTGVRTWVAAAACVLALAGCSEATSPDDPHDPHAPEESAVDQTPSTPAGPVEQSVADLAATLGIEPDEVEVVSVEEVTWRNGSRGCAEPGTSYTQALIDGARITLRAGGRTYEYHSGGSRPPTHCPRPTE